MVQTIARLAASNGELGAGTFPAATSRNGSSGGAPAAKKSSVLAPGSCAC